VALKFYDFLVPTQRRDFSTALIEVVSYSLMNWVLFASLFAVRKAANPTALGFRSEVALLAFLFGTPSFLALMFYYIKTWRWVRRLFRPVGIRITDPAPTAWDHFFREGLSCYIIFHLKSKEMIGASYDKDSFATTYPDIQEIYVEELWVIDPVTREFIKPANNTKGVIIKLDDCDYIEMYVRPPAEVKP